MQSNLIQLIFAIMSFLDAQNNVRLGNRTLIQAIPYTNPTTNFETTDNPIPKSLG